VSHLSRRLSQPAVPRWHPSFRDPELRTCNRHFAAPRASYQGGLPPGVAGSVRPVFFMPLLRRWFDGFFLTKAALLPFRGYDGWVHVWDLAIFIFLLNLTDLRPHSLFLPFFFFFFFTWYGHFFEHHSLFFCATVTVSVFDYRIPASKVPPLVLQFFLNASSFHRN